MTDAIKNIILFISLILVQIIVLNNVLLWGFINPLLYILFVVVYPFKRDRGLFLFFSFLLGLSLDFFLNSGGINAAATLFIAYIRLPLIKGILGKSEIDFPVFDISKLPFLNLLFFISILTLLHHFIVFSLEYFKFSAIGTIFYRTLLTSLFTIILLIFSLLFMNKAK